MKTLDFQNLSFRSRLQEELLNRCRRNPKYSLRSFAKSLGMSPSVVSELLNGKRKLTLKSIERIGLALGLSVAEIESFQKNQSDASGEARPSYGQITLDQYALISDWYHYAILELIKVPKAKHDARAIAGSLGITVSEVNLAIERLIRLELIHWEDDRLVDDSGGYSTNISGSLTSSASKQLQKQILEQSAEALMTLPIEIRNHTSMTMAIDQRHLPEAVKKIAEFRRELCQYLNSFGEPTDVYQLSISLFPVTNQERKDVSHG